jgi:hypothetical protein
MIKPRNAHQKNMQRYKTIQNLKNKRYSQGSANLAQETPEDDDSDFIMTPSDFGEDSCQDEDD